MLLHSRNLKLEKNAAVKSSMMNDVTAQTFITKEELSRLQQEDNSLKMYPRSEKSC